MSWPDIDTFIANQLVTATDMNEIKENLEFLLDSSPTRKQPSGNGSYTTTSTSHWRTPEVRRNSGTLLMISHNLLWKKDRSILCLT